MLAAPASPRTPNGKGGRCGRSSEDTVVSVFGVDGSRFIEELMSTDPEIVEGIARSGSLSSLLGSVYSPLRQPLSVSAPSPGPSSTSPWQTPDRKGYMFRFPMSPSMEPGLVRRSARLTPSHTPTAWTSESDDESGRGIKRRRPEDVPFRKSLKMDSATPSAEKREFETMVMGPISPMTPYLGSEPPGGKAKIFGSEEKRQRPSLSKRGEYKCGKCGFMPKKLKHDCNEQMNLQNGDSGGMPDDPDAGLVNNPVIAVHVPVGRSTPTLVQQNLVHRLHSPMSTPVPRPLNNNRPMMVPSMSNIPNNMVPSMSNIPNNMVPSMSNIPNNINLNPPIPAPTEWNAGSTRL